MNVKLERIVFWEPTVSIHKIPLLRQMAKYCPDIDLLYVSDKPVSNERLAQGWIADTENINFEIITSPSYDLISSIIEGEGNAFHIFSGIRHFSTLERAISMVLIKKMKFAIYSEPRVDSGFRGKLRFLQSFFLEYKIKKNVSFVLAIGKNGPAWFKKVGYSYSKVFPSAYYIDSFDSQSFELLSENDKPKKIQLAFVGRLCKEKGLDVFLEALTLLDYDEYEVTIIGRGELKGEVNKFIGKVSINYIEKVNSNNMVNHLKGFDILILPSTTLDDGWGVVVSEALLCGVAVVVSRFAGSSAVIHAKYIGEELQSVTSRSVAEAIEHIKNADLLRPEYRDMRRDWAIDNISSVAGAKYIMSLIFRSIVS